MAARYGSKKRYVVLPSAGIAAPTMEASLFQARSAGMLAGSAVAPTGAALARAMKSQLAVFASEANTSIMSAVSASAELAGGIGEQDFEVLSQRFSDGPAVVAMTDAARLALEASQPNVRVVPVTQYHLPGAQPRRSSKSKPAATGPAGRSAMSAEGKVFTADLKQRFLAGIAGDSAAAGKDVVVGFLDTGVDNDHPALKNRVTMRRSFTGDALGPVDWGPDNKDRAGHGTHVAGIIAAEAGHGGPAGVAPQAELISYRIFPDSGNVPRPAENAVIIDSIRAAVDDGCHIVNLSIEGSKLREDGVRTAIQYAWNNGVICIAAAGNGFGNPVSYPAAHPQCIAVTAIGRDGDFPAEQDFQQHVSDNRSEVDDRIFLAAFSNFGPRVQFTAPGHAIVSTFPGGGWWFLSGTSMAAPFVTGMLARLLSDNPNILNALGNADRSAAMRQMLVGRAKALKLPQTAYEGYGLPA